MSHFLTRAAAPYSSTGKTVTIVARRWSSESMRAPHENWLGKWPAECTAEQFEAAVRLVHEQFGTPKHRASKSRIRDDGLEHEEIWYLPARRADEVLELLDRIPTCVGGEHAPVHASYFCLFRLKNLDTGVLLPKQGKRYQPRLSSLSVELQRRSVAEFHFVMPFARADAAVADYVVALQEHAPVWMDPRYFDEFVPAQDGSRYDRRRLPPEWLGLGADGTPRLDASSSGIVPPYVPLPSDADMDAESHEAGTALFHERYHTVRVALEENPMAALVIRGAVHRSSYLVEEAAERSGLVLHVVSTDRLGSRSPSFVEELQSVVSALDERPTVLLITVMLHGDPELSASIMAQAPGRTIHGVSLPSQLRLVVAHEVPPSEEARAAAERQSIAEWQGFANRRQLEFFARQTRRASDRDLFLSFLRL